MFCESDPHVPDVNTFDGIVDVFSLANIMELSNVIHHRTYMPGGLSVQERLDMIHGRARARQIVQWIVHTYRFEGDFSLSEFYWLYLAHQAKTLFLTKSWAEEAATYSFNGKPIAHLLLHHLRLSFEGFDTFWKCWDGMTDEPEKLTWVLPGVYKVIQQHLGGGTKIGKWIFICNDIVVSDLIYGTKIIFICRDIILPTFSGLVRTWKVQLLTWR
jgi:hypothetical protein